MKKFISLFMLSMILLPSGYTQSNLNSFYDPEKNNLEIKMVSFLDAKGFRLCDKSDPTTTCKQIGDKAFYSKEELAKIKSSEKIEAWLKLGGSYVIASGSICLAATLGILGIPTVMAIAIFDSATPFIPMALLETATYVSVPYWFKKLNPVRQFKQARVLDKDFKNLKTNKDILKVATLLEEVLN